MSSARLMTQMVKMKLTRGHFNSLIRSKLLDSKMQVRTILGEIQTIEMDYKYLVTFKMDI